MWHRRAEQLSLRILGTVGSLYVVSQKQVLKVHRPVEYVRILNPLLRDSEISSLGTGKRYVLIRQNASRGPRWVSDLPTKHEKSQHDDEGWLRIPLSHPPSDFSYTIQRAVCNLFHDPHKGLCARSLIRTPAFAHSRLSMSREVVPETPRQKARRDQARLIRVL